MSLESPLVDPGVLTRLRQARASVEIAEAATVMIRGVPARAELFNKSRTNVLVKRPRPGLPFVIFVDADLTYTGADRSLVRAFATGPTHEGWRALHLAGGARDADEAMRQVLSILGFLEEEAPAEDGGRPRRPLGPSLEALTQELPPPAADGLPSTLSRRLEEATLEIVSCLVRWGQRRLPILRGGSGVGKTHVMREVGGRLSGLIPARRVRSCETGRLLAGCLFASDSERLLERVLQEVLDAPEVVLLLEGIDALVRETRRAAALLVTALDGGARLLGTTSASLAGEWSRTPLARRAQVIPLVEPSQAETLEILQGIRRDLVHHHGVDIDDSCLATGVRWAASLPGHYPARAIDLLDAAAARARLAKARVIGMDDLLKALESLREGFPG